MHWNKLRLAPTDGNGNGSKRYSSLFPSYASRHSEHVHRPAVSRTRLDRRLSDSGPRPQLEDAEGSDARSDDPLSGTNHASNGHVEDENDPPRASPLATAPERRQSLKRNRFSMLRFRHASDPQLSSTYAQADPDAPPVPDIRIPPPPTIITTAPTNSNLEKSARKNKLRMPLAKKPSREGFGLGLGGRNSAIGGKIDLPMPGSTRISHEDSARLSTSSFRSGNAASQPERDARFSESSRSERSSGDRASSKAEPSHPHKKFSMLRLKKSRGPLFPLPVKIPLPGTSNSPSDTTGRSSPYPNTPDRDHLSPLPSPTQSSVKLSSPKGNHPPHLFRKDSTTSARSVNSSSSAKGRLGRRGRSSTLNSLIDARRADDPQSSSLNLASGRTSTSTSGRKSFGDMFHFSHRSRQNSVPPGQRDGNSSPLPPGTPGSDSKAGSYSISRDLVSFPDREESDTPTTYLSKLQEAVHKGAIATILSKSDDDFYKVTLRKFMRTFVFFGEPIDMAIRKLLMEVELPKETQQIDRVLQSFADRYYECNPGIFVSTDQTYFIAFSILILHTDVFNKNNKRKMQKQDYVKISRVDGISEDILECFYENISYTPFIHVEDELNLSARQMPKPKRALFKAASTDHLTRVSREPVDPYAVILDGKLDTLRPSLKDVMDIEDTYSFPGAEEPKDIEALHEAFAKSAILQIVSARSRPDAFMTPTSIDNPAGSHPGLVDIRVVKVGLLWRKDPRKKRARSPWQEWGALLTSSQLYFFRDINWTKSLMAQYEARFKGGFRLPVMFEPPVSDFKPDAIMSTSDAVALSDSSYKRHKHAFVLNRHGGLEEVFLANTDADMDDWLAKLNYAATFRTTGVPLKGTVGTQYEGIRHQIKRGSVASDTTGSQGDGATVPSATFNSRLAEEMSAARQQLMAQRIAEANEKLSACQRELDELLRNARHLQVLTPVNTRARETVILAAGRMSAKLKWVRLDMWRSKCYKRFLSLDLGIDEKEPADAQKRTSYTTTAKTVTSGPSQRSLARLDSGDSFATAPQGSDAISGGSLVPSGEITGPEHFASPPDSSDARRPSVSPSAVSSEVALPEKSQATSEGTERVPTPQNSLRVKTLEREPSVLSSRSRAEAGSLGSPSSRFNISSVDDGEEQILRESGLLGIDGLTNASRLSGLTDEADNMERPTEEKQEASAGELRGRSRRSLQRTLRDSHHGPGHQRSKKGHDSASSIPNLDNISGHNEGEGLSRKDSNFTLHGKKASVITFGSEWQNMSTEERLKLRKPTPSDEPRSSEPSLIGEAAESIQSASIHSGHPPSIRSASTATARSSRFADNVSVAGGIPEVPSLDALKKEQTPASSSDYKSNESAGSSARYPLSSSASTSTGKVDTSSDDTAIRGEIDRISKQEKTRPSPQEQAVGA